MTSCSDDAALQTDIHVAPQIIKAAVGTEHKITVKAVPTYTLESQNTSIVSINGYIAKIDGVGTTTITVTSGSFSKTIPVEGIINGIVVTDSIDATVGTFQYNGTPISFTLTATITPANSGKTPEWSSNVETAIVTANSDGLTATVTIIDEGSATITADVGGITGAYTISTRSMFESAKGYWTFDDETNLGKASVGDDLSYEEGSIVVTDGPSATKKAVTITTDYLGFKWDPHGITGDGLTNFSILIDAWVPIEPDRMYYTIYWNNSYAGSLYFRPRDGAITINRSGGTDGTWAEGMAGNEPWSRVVVTYSPLEPDGDDLRCHITVYVNGQQVFEGDHNGAVRTNILEGQPLWFLVGETRADNNPYPVSTIAVWDHVLTPEQVASLGGVSR
jgi:hypothetical protein